MVRMGLRESGVVRWCRILLDGSTCRVRLNGAFTVAFPVESGLFQGSSLSCQEWVIAMQPLVSYLNTLQAQQHIAALQLPSGEPAPAVCLHADDTKSAMLDPDRDGPVVKEAFALARAAGMPALNASKTCLLPLFSGPAPPGSITLGLDASGEQRHLPTGFRTLSPGHEPHRLLGVPFAADAAACTEAAYHNMLPKVEAKIREWSVQRLTTLGRAHVANQCLASKSTYQANFSDPGESLQKGLQMAMTHYISKAGTPEEEQPYEAQPFVKQRVLSLAPASGGVGAPNMQLAAASMRAKPLWKVFFHSPHPVWQLVTHEVSAALPAPPDAPPGIHLLITRPALPPAFPPHVTLSAKHAVEAFRQLRVQRIATPEQQDFPSIMLELTFTAEGAEGRPRQEELSTEAARSWLRLSQVREAGLRQEQLSAEERADWERIVAALPARWREEVRRVLAPVPEWACISPAEGSRPAVFRGPDLSTAAEGEMRLWELWPAGNMVPLSFPLVPGPAALQPAALVVWQPKPQSAWSRADFTAATAQALLPADQRVGVREPRLVGVWDSLGLDPRVFGVPACPGHAPCSLLHMSARRARKAMAHLRLTDAAPNSDDFVRGYKEEGAAFPPAWAQAPAEDDTDLATLSLDDLDLHGWRGQDEKWRRSAVQLRQQWVPQADDLPLNEPQPWVGNPGARAPPRPSPADRAAARVARQEEEAEAAMQGALLQLPQGYKGAWQRLADPTMQRSFRVTAWRLMHNSLGCGAFLAHARSRAARANGASAAVVGVAESRARCKAPCCAPAPGAPIATAPLETPSHAFLTCPDVVEAIEWMRATWAHLTDINISLVPSDADVLLYDNLDGWEDAPAGKAAQRLWSRLRVATLGAIWQARCERDADGLPPGTTLACRAASLAQAAVAGAIRRDWARAVDVAPSSLPSLCAAWYRGLDLAISLSAFKEEWAEPGFFCQVHEVAGQKPTLELLLGSPLCPPLPL
jgi:hypothetical protein